MVKGEAYESSVVVFASFVLSARGPHAGNVLEDAARVRVPHYRFLPAPAGLFHQRRRHCRSDADGERGRRCERHHLACNDLPAVRLRRERGLLHRDIVLCRCARQRGRPPLHGDADRPLRGADRCSHGAGAGAARPHARVDQRHARERGGLPRGLYLLRHPLRRHRRAAFL